MRFGRTARAARAPIWRWPAGVQTPPVLGSRATHLVSRMGGLDGRALLAGDVLPVAGGSARRGRIVRAA